MLQGSCGHRPKSPLQNRGFFKSSYNQFILNVPLFKTLVKIQALSLPMLLYKQTCKTAVKILSDKRQPQHGTDGPITQAKI